MTELERPYLYLHNVHFKLLSLIGEGIPDWKMFVEFSFINYGRTPATIFAIRKIGITHKTRQISSLGEERLIETKGISVAPVNVPRQQVPYRFEFNITPAVHSKLYAGEMFAYFIGEVAYRDIFENEHVCGFAVRTEPVETILYETADGCDAFNFQRTTLAKSKTTLED